VALGNKTKTAESLKESKRWQKLAGIIK